MRTWNGKLRLRDGREEGAEVEAKIVITDSGTIVFDVRGDDGKWIEGDPAKIHPRSWLRALGETGKEVP